MNVVTYSPRKRELKINDVLATIDQVKSLSQINDCNMSFQRLVEFGYDMDKVEKYYESQK